MEQNGVTLSEAESVRNGEMVVHVA